MKAMLAIGAFLFSFHSTANAASYSCMMSVIPDQPQQQFTWDGLAPKTMPFTYKNQAGRITIEAIGAAGHPDYLFSIRLGNKSLLSASQPKDLTDYAVIWQSDVANSTNLISLSCYTRAAVEEE